MTTTTGGIPALPLTAGDRISFPDYRDEQHTGTVTNRGTGYMAVVEDDATGELHRVHMFEDPWSKL